MDRGLGAEERYQISGRDSDGQPSRRRARRRRKLTAAVRMHSCFLLLRLAMFCGHRRVSSFWDRVFWASSALTWIIIPVMQARSRTHVFHSAVFSELYRLSYRLRAALVCVWVHSHARGSEPCHVQGYVTAGDFTVVGRHGLPTLPLVLRQTWAVLTAVSSRQKAKRQQTNQQHQE